MQAIVQDTYGTAAVLQSREIPKPVIADNEVLVRVRAAGVNPADWAVMSGLSYVARPVYGMPDVEDVTGAYFANARPQASNEASYDKRAAARLWQVSAGLVGQGAWND